MVGTIAPLVKVAPRQWSLSTLLFLAFSGIAAGFAGFVLGAIGDLLLFSTRSAALILATGAILLALAELHPGLQRYPALGGSVPRSWWERFGPTRGAIAYGGVLGLGITTVVPYASFYVMPLGAFVLGPVGGAILGMTYGVARALPVPLASFAILLGTDPHTVGDLSVGIDRRPVKLVSAGLLVTLGAVTLVSLALAPFVDR